MEQVIKKVQRQVIILGKYLKLRKVNFSIFFVGFFIVAIHSGLLAQQTTRLGLFHTQEELDIWRERSKKGPFKTKGDAYTHSPNEWERMYQNAMNVLNDFSDAREIWKGVNGTYRGSGVNRKRITNPKDPKYWSGKGEIPPSAGPKPAHNMRDLSDAAFISLVLKNSDTNLSKRLSDVVRSVLMKQIAVANLDVTNSSPGQTTFWPRYPSSQWTKNISDRNPGFTMASMLQNMLFAYDYLKDDFTASETKKLDQWFYNQAEYWAHNLDVAHELYYVNRNSGNYTLTQVGKEMEQGRNPNISAHIRFNKPSEAAGGGWRKDSNGNIIKVLPKGKADIAANYVNSPNEVSGLVIKYNNRFLNLAKFVAMVGVMQNNQALKKSAKMYWKETLMFSIYPDGTPGELERWINARPQEGFHYANIVTEELTVIADVFARAGDFDLYEYKTRHGAFGTECKPGDPDKSLKRVIESMFKLMDGTYKRYASNDKQKVGNVDYRVWDRLKPGTGYRGEYMADETWYAQANIYYKDNYIKNAYLRKNSGMNPHIPNPENRGPHSPYEGPWGEFPSKMFMFGLMEGKVWPYPSSKGGGNTNNDPVITDINDIKLTAGTTKDIKVSATDPDKDKIKLSVSDLPSFVTFKDNGNGTGKFIITPKQGDEGEYQIIVHAADGKGGKASKKFTITIEQDYSNWKVTSVSLVNAETNKIVGVLKNGDDIDLEKIGADKLNFVANTNPETVGSVVFGFNGATNYSKDNSAPYSLEGEAWSATPGNHTISASVYSEKDGKGAKGKSLEVSFTIIEPESPEEPENTAPVISNIDNINMTIGGTRDIKVSATDPDKDKIQLSAKDLPSFVTFKDNGNGTGNFAVAPKQSNEGQYQITVHAADGKGGKASKKFTITIEQDYSNWKVTSISLVNAETNKIVGVLKNGADIDLEKIGTDKLNFVANTNPETVGSVVFGFNGATNYSKDNSAPYSLEGEAWSATPGNHTISASVFSEKDGKGAKGKSLEISFTIIEPESPEEPENNAPVIKDIPDQHIGIDETLTVKVFSSDLDGDKITLSVAELPPFAKFKKTNNGEGYFIFHPSNGNIGEYNIKVTATDGKGASDSKSFTLTVEKKEEREDTENVAPQIKEIPDQTMTAGDKLKLEIVATDKENGKIVLGTLDTPEFIVLTDSGHGKGKLTIGPSHENIGEYSITVTASDDQGESSSQTFKLLVIDEEEEEIEPIHVTEFILMNAETGKKIQRLAEGDVLDLEKLGTDRFNIFARTNPATPGSVVFALNGQGKEKARIDNKAPYTLVNNQGNNKNNYWTPVAGPYTLLATAYTEKDANGLPGRSHAVNFEVIEGQKSNKIIQNFTLINAGTNQEIGQLNDGDVINLETIGTNKLNIRTDIGDNITGSIVFSFDGKNKFRFDNSAPYTLAGDLGWRNYSSWIASDGHHTITATIFSEKNGRGEILESYTIDFKVTGNNNLSNVLTADADAVILYPNPVINIATIKFAEKEQGKVSIIILGKSGEKVYQDEVVMDSYDDKLEMDLSNLREGDYFLKLKTEKVKNITLRLIKEK